MWSSTVGVPARPGRSVLRLAGPWLGWSAGLALSVAGLGLAVVGADDLARAGILRSALLSAEHTMVGPALLVVVGLVFLAERAWPAVPRPARARAHMVDAGYLALFALVAPAVTLLNTGFAIEIERHARFLLIGRLPLIPRTVVVAAVLLGIDAMNWLAHLANHRLGVFWRFHALHHSQEDMSVLTTFRTHPLAHVSYLPALLPGLVLASSGTVPAVGLVVYGCLVTLPHANLSWRYGRLGRMVVSPAFHRLHHSAAPVGGRPAVNFGFVLTVWDRLAGTAAFPEPGVVVATGLAGRPIPVEQSIASGRDLPRVVASQLGQPFRLHRQLEESR